MYYGSTLYQVLIISVPLRIFFFFIALLPSLQTSEIEITPPVFNVGVLTNQALFEK